MKKGDEPTTGLTRQPTADGMTWEAPEQQRMAVAEGDNNMNTGDGMEEGDDGVKERWRQRDVKKGND